VYPALPQRIATAVAATVADLVAAGTSGVLLLGSQVRGDAHEHSDVNLVALGNGPDYTLRQVHELLMSVSWRTADEVLDAFANPREAGGAVPGWRSALILHDADGELATLVEAARGWRWSDIEDRRRGWIANQVTIHAEQVNRLVGSLAMGRQTSAAVSRNLLATQLPIIAAVHRQILYDSEHRLFDLVAGAMGERWQRSQEASLALRAEALDESCRAALDLYAMLTPAVDDYLTPDQRAVATAAAELAWTAQRVP
jgi:predicted nucleotidyltransferase